MTKKQPRADDFADLRRRAEEKAHTDEAQAQKPLSPKESGRLLHELQVHQIELEMQNEELRRAQGELEAARRGISTSSISRRWVISRSASRG